LPRSNAKLNDFHTWGVVADYIRRFSDKPPGRLKTPGTQASWAGATFRGVNAWWQFCLLVLAIKLLLLWLDPRAKLFMGDSGAYIHTALTG